MASCILTAPGLLVVRRLPCSLALASRGSVKGPVQVSHSLHSLKGGYIGDNIGE